MKRSLISKSCIFSLLILATACVSKEQQAKQELYNQNLETAKRNFSQEDEQNCIKSFKNGMNDPNSLQILGHATFGIMFEGNAVYAIPIRAKNAFGGLIRSEIECQYSLRGSKFVFDHSYN